jgi:hypothetical protein
MFLVASSAPQQLDYPDEWPTVSLDEGVILDRIRTWSEEP